MEAEIALAHEAYLAGDLAGAQVNLRRLNEQYPQQPDVMLRLGQVQFRLGNFREAQGFFQEASQGTS